MSDYKLSQLDELEAESIHIIREAVAESENPVLLSSLGKDSSVLLHLASKAFAPGDIPFPLLHVDTGFLFKEMIEFRDYIEEEYGVNVLVQKNKEERAQELEAEDAHSEEYIYLKKTKPLLNALKKHEFDCAFGGARRDEEKSRAKERIFSIRSEHGVWDPKDQRPELWHLYNAKLADQQNMRVFPLSNWTELDVWQYIKREELEVVSLYYAQQREVVERNGMILSVDEFVQPKEEEEVKEEMVRYRTLGCSPSTGAVYSDAETVEEIIQELKESNKSERSNRAIDDNSESAMEDKKKEGYF
ncbi:MAG: sulfate adenylyltransferase subunit CysD [Candidatus Magasanikbacteria bacterium]